MGAGLGKALSAACFSNDVLLLALKAGETDVVAEHLEAHPNAATGSLSVRDGNSAFHVSAATGRLDCLDLSYAAASKHYSENQSSPVKAGKSLRRCINRRNTYGQTALMMACKHGHAEAVTWLLGKGADPMLFDSIHSRACLHYCALYGQSTCVEALFQSNVMVESVDGRQPLSQAQIVDSQGIHKFVDVRAAMGFTPIHMAASQGHWQTVAALLANGASLTVRCYGVLRADFTVPARWKPNSTPLHIAAARGSTSMVKCMLQAFAEQALQDPSLVDIRLMRDFSGQRPVDVAMSFGYERLAVLLDPSQPIELLSTHVARAGRDLKMGPPQLRVLACRALRRKLTDELDKLDQQLAPRRMQRQPSAAALARRRSAAVTIDPGLLPVPVETAATAPRIDVSAVASNGDQQASPPQAIGPLRARAAIAAIRVGNQRGSQAPPQAGATSQPPPPAWTSLLPPARPPLPPPALQPAAPPASAPRPSPFAAMAALSTGDGGSPTQGTQMDRAAITQLSVRFHDDAEPVGGAQSSSPQPQPQTPPPPVQKASAKRARSLLGRRRGSMELVLGEADGSAPPQTPPEPPDSEAPERGVVGADLVDPADAVLTEMTLKSRRASMARVHSIPRAPSVASTLDGGECEICFDNPVEVAIAACGHRFCADCVRQVCVTNRDRVPLCAYCRQTIDRLVLLPNPR